MRHSHDNFTAFIALGANLQIGDDDLKATLADAIHDIAGKTGVLAESRTFHTPCFPENSGPDYLNAAISVDWKGESSDLLMLLHDIEQQFGRERGTRWAARSLDLDIIGHGTRVSPDVGEFRIWADLPLARQMVLTPEQLILPHPRLQDRAFVLGPMMDIAPDWQHPVLGRTIRQMWNDLPATDRAAIHPV